MISVEEYLGYVDDALDGMVQTLTQLGDERANQAPDVAGANSPYVLLVHCLGVMNYWAGTAVAGRSVERDRDAEFRAHGSVAEVVELTKQARQQLEEDLADLEPAAPPRGDPYFPVAETQGGFLMHIYRELSQHRGHMDITRDLLLAR